MKSLKICIIILIMSANTVFSQSLSGALMSKQAQFDRGVQAVADAFQEIKNIHMVNKINRAYMDSYGDSYYKPLGKQMSTMDFSIPANVKWAIDQIRKPITSNVYIRNEIKIINRLIREAGDISNTEKTSASLEQRKKNILGFYEEYGDADPKNTQALLKKYSLDFMMLTESLEF